MVGRLRGDPNTSNPLASDLPKLLAGFKPTMTLDSVSIWSTTFGKDRNDNFDDRFDAIEFTVRDSDSNGLYPMAKVGTVGKLSTVETFKLTNPLDRIDILYNENRVCNVKFVDSGSEDVTGDYDMYGDEDDMELGEFSPIWIEGDDLESVESPYAIKNDFCIEGAQGIEIMKVAMDEMLPLIGIHGRSSMRGPGLESLGFIWYNNEEEECQKQIRRPGGRGNIMDVNTAEALVSPDLRREWDIYESLLIEVDTRFAGESALEDIIRQRGEGPNG